MVMKTMDGVIMKDNGVTMKDDGWRINDSDNGCKVIGVIDERLIAVTDNNGCDR